MPTAITPNYNAIAATGNFSQIFENAHVIMSLRGLTVGGFNTVPPSTWSPLSWDASFSTVPAIYDSLGFAAVPAPAGSFIIPVPGLGLLDYGCDVVPVIQNAQFALIGFNGTGLLVPPGFAPPAVPEITRRQAPNSPGFTMTAVIRGMAWFQAPTGASYPITVQPLIWHNLAAASGPPTRGGDISRATCVFWPDELPF